MDFRGHLRLPDDAGDGIPVVLRLDDIYVILTHENEELGAWRADDVEIERLFSNQFSMDLAGEPMVFVASDALGFAYEGIAAITDLQERLTKRRLFKRSKKKPRDAEAEQPPEPAPAPKVAQRPQRTFPDVPAPQEARSDEPDFDESVAAATSTRQQPDPAEDTERPPVFDSPGTEPTMSPKPIWTPPEIPAAGPSTAPAQEVSPVFEPPARSPEPTPSPAQEEEPALEIEEVESTAGGYSEPAAPAEQERSDAPPVEIDIDEYVMPAGGVTDVYVPAADVPEVGSETHPPETVPESVDESVSVSAPESEPVQSASVAAPDTPSPDDDHEAGERPAAVESAGSTATEPQPGMAMDNGFHDEPTVTIDETTSDSDSGKGRHEEDGPKRKRTLFGRSKEKEVPDHDHVFGPPKTIGGLTRAVCEICGHVTFSGEDVYQDW